MGRNLQRLWTGICRSGGRWRKGWMAGPNGDILLQLPMFRNKKKRVKQKISLAICRWLCYSIITLTYYCCVSDKKIGKPHMPYMSASRRCQSRIGQKRLSSSKCTMISSTWQWRILQSRSIVFTSTFLLCRSRLSWERLILWYVYKSYCVMSFSFMVSHNRSYRIIFSSISAQYSIAFGKLKSLSFFISGRLYCAWIEIFHFQSAYFNYQWKINRTIVFT